MNRRSFLKIASASAAAIGMPSIIRAETLGRNGAVAPSNKITVGLIGSGGQGRGIMSNALRNDAARVVAVCDVDKGMRGAGKGAVNSAYKNNDCAEYVAYEELLARKDIDAVLIATPDHWHALMTVHAARAGKHIYCEKPAATTITEGRAMVDAVERAGIVCQIGSMQRSFSEFQRTIALSQAGYLGKIKSVKVGLPTGGGGEQKTPEPGPDFDYERWIGPARFVPFHKNRAHWNWRWQYNFAGGQLADWIGHHYDCAAVAMGVAGMQPVAIEKVSFTARDPHPVFDTVTAYAFEAHYANGVVLDVSTGHRGGLTIEGEEGSVWVNRGKIEHSTKALGSLVIPTRHLALARGAPSHMDNFLECVRTGATPRCPMNEAHNIAAVAHLANACIRSNMTGLKWNPATESIVGDTDAAPLIGRTYRAPFIFPA
jgi:predicted dehydrogenase